MKNRNIRIALFALVSISIVIVGTLTQIAITNLRFDVPLPVILLAHVITSALLVFVTAMALLGVSGFFEDVP